MKKQALKKLNLAKETIRELVGEELREIAGGAPSCTSCDHSTGTLTSLASEYCTKIPR